MPEYPKYCELYNSKAAAVIIATFRKAIDIDARYKNYRENTVLLVFQTAAAEAEFEKTAQAMHWGELKPSSEVALSVFLD